ncbi:unnamed protein product [Peniophora sp. CBMAI 1063]|nr:unnamed protein product [Peniophora sp. CBMAI 1063]
MPESSTPTLEGVDVEPSMLDKIEQDNAGGRIAHSLSTLKVAEDDVPLWVKDIVDAQNDTDSDTGESEDEDPGDGTSSSAGSLSSESSSKNPKLVQALIDYPFASIADLRRLYTDRVRLGTNEELWDAMEAVTLLFGCPNEFVSEAEAALVFPEIFDSGFIDFLELIILDGDLFEDCTEWTVSVLACLEQLSDLGCGKQHWTGTEWRDNDPGDPDDEDFPWVPLHRDAFRQRLAELFAHFAEDAWAHRHLFDVGCPNDLYNIEDWAPPSSDVREKLRGILLMSPYLRMSPFKQNEGVLRVFRQLCLLLWMAPDDDFDKANTLFAVMIGTFDSGTFLGMANSPFTEFVAHDVLAVHGAEPVLEQICQSLNRQEALGLGLNHTVFAGATSILLCPGFWPHFSRMKVLPAVECAMDYILQEYPRSGAEFDLLIHWAKLAHLLAQDATFANGAAVLIRDTRLAARLGHFAIVSLDARVDADIVPYEDTVGGWIKIATALNLRRGKNEMRKKFKQSLRREWYPTLNRLRFAPCADEVRRKKIILIWETLGLTMQLEESKEKADYEREIKRTAQFCAWKDCRFHTVKPDMPTRACAGCDEVRYCGKPCQQKDWKEGGHKLQCRRIKAK